MALPISPLERYTTNELVAELVRRNAWPPKPQGILTAGDTRFDPDNRLAWWSGHCFTLTPRPGRLLGVLFQVYPRGMTRQQLIAAVYPDAFWPQSGSNLHQDLGYLRSLMPGFIGPTGTIHRAGVLYRILPENVAVEPICDQPTAIKAYDRRLRYDGTVYLQHVGWSKRNEACKERKHRAVTA